MLKIQSKLFLFQKPQNQCQQQQHYDLSCVSFVIVDYTKKPHNVKEERENFIFIQLHALSLKQEKSMENCRFKKEYGYCADGRDYQLKHKIQFLPILLV